MESMRAKPAAADAQQRARATAAEDRGTALEGKIRLALEKNYLKGKKLVGLKIRQVDGNSVEGFLKISGVKGERRLVDFRVTSSSQGALTALEVDGRKISLAVSGAAKR